MVAQSASAPAPGAIRTAEVLAALSLATDLGTGREMGHALRACHIGMELAHTLQLAASEQAELYYSFLLMHSGCTVLSLELAPVIHGDELAAIADGTLRDDANPLDMLAWLWNNVAADAPLPLRVQRIFAAMLQDSDGQEQLRGVCAVAARVAQRLGMPIGVQATVGCYLERWDGKGPYGLRGNAIPLGARLLHAALMIEALHTARGRQAAEAWVLAQNGRTLDPQVVDAFVSIARQPDLWATLAMPDPWDVVLAREPDSPYCYLAEAQLDDVALAVADFVDLKSPTTVNHSRDTAVIAEAIAHRMGLAHAEVVTIRRAALVHDLGLVAVPGHILHQPGPLSAGDQERLRLHPYYTERILARVPALAEVAAIAGKHHERLDGTGYYRGLAGSELSTAACILALADEFQDQLQVAPGLPAVDPGAVLHAMQLQVGTLFSPACFEALAQEYGLAVPKPRRKRTWPAGLTDREIEVLRLLATGANNRQIAQALVVTDKTVAHHLEHIYNKIGISSRAAAVFFAMEHELIA